MRTLHMLLILALVLPAISLNGQQPSLAAPELPLTDWPQYQHDPSHSGRTPAVAFNSGPLYLQWAHSFGERVEVEAQPVIASGVVYQGVMNGEMHAIQASTGTTLWIRRHGGPIPHTAAVDEQQVYYGSLDGKVYALAVSDGHVVWEYQTNGPVISAPALANGMVYIGSRDGSLYALNAATGQKVWNFPTGGPVITSPAVSNGKVYFGSEDLYARAVNAGTGEGIWAHKLTGFSMRNTHPVVADNGSVVIFLTVKPGASSYAPYEDFPNVSPSASPVNTWNAFYQAHPTHRYLYYLNALDGADLWNPSTRRYVPMPIPYWGLIHPIIGPDGFAWFPVPAGTQGTRDELDHDNRLFKVNLATGEAFQVAGAGSPMEYQLRQDESGRQMFSGSDYYYTISEDLGVFKPSNGNLRALFSNGDPSGYNFGSHMNPHSPLPSLHLWRYGGSVSMGGLAGASVPIVANGMVFFTSYGWLYAVGPTDKGLNPATSFPSRDGRLYELTYPRSQAPTLTQIRAEIDSRVAAILALGPTNPPVAARWEQPHKPLMQNEFSFELYGYDADLVRSLSAVYPYLSTGRQTELRIYLSTFVTTKLLNPTEYERGAWNTRCLVYGEPGIQSGDANCRVNGEIASIWYAWNPNLIGLRLHALWAYANATGDWAKITTNWAFIEGQFRDTFLDPSYCRPVPGYGYCIFELWRTGRLNVPAQIAAAQAVRDMAIVVGDTGLSNDANAFLNTLLSARYELAFFVPDLYAAGLRQPAPLTTNPDGTINNYQLMLGGPYNNELIPYSAALRDANTDPSQVNWWDGDDYIVDAGMNFMQYQALSGYFPMSYELADLLRSSLLEKTRYYVKSYEVNSPWWWMADMAHHTTCSGEHLYHSPTLSWTMFQTKAYVLQEDWSVLARQLPMPVTFNDKYDLYRLENLAAVMELASEDLSQSSITVSDSAPESDDIINYTITIRNTGSGFVNLVSLTNTLPGDLAYIPGSLTASLGVVDDSANPVLHWSGVMNETPTVTISYSVEVNVPPGTRKAVNNVASIFTENTGTVIVDAAIIVNGLEAWLPYNRR